MSIEQHDEVVCIVGVGLGTALLGNEDKFKTDKMISEMLKYPCIQKSCPILALLFPPQARLTFESRLNYVWTHLAAFGQVALTRYEEVLKAYTDLPYPLRNLRDGIEFLKPLYSPSHMIAVLLEWELKRLIATVYKNVRHNGNFHTRVKRSIDSNEHENFKKFVNDLKDKNKKVTWISLNYDTVLEEMLGALGIEWQYCFQDLVATCDRSDARHVVVKPHGSLNVWFRSDWPGSTTVIGELHKREQVFSHRIGLACHLQRYGHTFFQGKLDWFETCSPKRIGVKVKKNYEKDKPLERKSERKSCVYYEFRPWLVGYLPDEFQHELNTPGVFADPAHDLCKLNLGHAGLVLSRAKELYIFGYSMPVEDKFIWNRIKALAKETKKAMKAEVASGGDTDRIVKELRNCGIEKVNEWGKSPYYI